ncbi:MAG TPA: hypothetical protein VFW96_14310 [Thermomicrobiales bacterium]|nr:hypothetical protein [Thermomicrobiales bacterium]
MERYTVNYRGSDARGRPALIVTDAAGDACLFSEGVLQVRCAGPHAAARLAGLLAGRATWTAVPRAAPDTPAGLRRLVAVSPDSTDNC